MSLEQLMDVKVVGAAKYEQPLNQAAAAVSVITRGEIKAFGWGKLAAALDSLPGGYTTCEYPYCVIGTPPVLSGGDPRTAAEALADVAVTERGAPGTTALPYRATPHASSPPARSNSPETMSDASYGVMRSASA